MGYTNFPGGISSMGVPLTGPKMTTGSVFFVDSNTGSNGNSGKDKDHPFADIDYAVGRCTANKGDIIYVMPGHNEGITTAAAIDLDIAGISVIGLGTGSLVPTIDFDAAAASVAIGADNVTVENIWFRPSFADIVVGLDIEDGSDYATVRRCKFFGAETATDEFLICIRTNDASNYATIEDCFIDMGAQGAESGIAFVKDTLGTRVSRNIIQGDFSTAVIKGITTKSERLIIEDNTLVNGDPDGALNTEPCIELLTGTSAIIRHNYMACDVATFILMNICDGGIFMDNWYTDDTASTGVAAQTSASATASADG